MSGVEIPPGVAPTPFTPTLTQGTAVAITVSYARYQKIGRVAVVQLYVTATGAGTAANGITIGGIPAAIAPLQVSNQASCGVGLFVDISAGLFHNVVITASSSSTFNMFGYARTNFFGLDPGITVASGDILSLEATYETAS